MLFQIITMSSTIVLAIIVWWIVDNYYLPDKSPKGYIAVYTPIPDYNKLILSGLYHCDRIAENLLLTLTGSQINQLHKRIQELPVDTEHKVMKNGLQYEVLLPTGFNPFQTT